VGTFDGIHSKQFPFVQANFYAFLGMSPGFVLSIPTNKNSRMTVDDHSAK